MNCAVFYTNIWCFIAAWNNTQFNDAVHLSLYRAFFGAQFYTNCAVLNEIVGVLKTKLCRCEMGIKS